MLKSLKIRNYRNLKSIELNSLKRINLITGKNNTGKSSLLEAILLYTSKGGITRIFQILDDRGENYKNNRENEKHLEFNLKSLSSLFTDRKINYNEDGAILFQSVDDKFQGASKGVEKLIRIRFVKYIEEIINQVENAESVSVHRKRTTLDEITAKNALDFHVGLEIFDGSVNYTIPLEDDRIFRYGYRSSGLESNFQYVKTSDIDKDKNGKLWDVIALTEKETFVIDALRIIEPKIERIAFIEESLRTRTAVVKLSDAKDVFPIKSMGDGINRILTIILALVCSENGFLLLDEFENGLHYSVQEQLWEVIFKLSKDLSVQVFVTTHSNDCIKGFEKVLGRITDKKFGQIVRLEKFNEMIKQVEFDYEELNTATNNNIEIR